MHICYFSCHICIQIDYIRAVKPIFTSIHCFYNNHHQTFSLKNLHFMKIKYFMNHMKYFIAYIQYGCSIVLQQLAVVSIVTYRQKLPLVLTIAAKLQTLIQIGYRHINFTVIFLMRHVFSTPLLSVAFFNSSAKRNANWLNHRLKKQHSIRVRQRHLRLCDNFSNNWLYYWLKLYVIDSSRFDFYWGRSDQQQTDRMEQ